MVGKDVSIDVPTIEDAAAAFENELPELGIRVAPAAARSGGYLMSL